MNNKFNWKRVTISVTPKNCRKDLSIASCNIHATRFPISLFNFLFTLSFVDLDLSFSRVWMSPYQISLWASRMIFCLPLGLQTKQIHSKRFPSKIKRKNSDIPPVLVCLIHVGKCWVLSCGICFDLNSLSHQDLLRNLLEHRSRVNITSRLGLAGRKSLRWAK